MTLLVVLSTASATRSNGARSMLGREEVTPQPRCSEAGAGQTCWDDGAPDLFTGGFEGASKCLPFCKETACVGLNGNTEDECSGCPRSYRCSPGAPGFGVGAKTRGLGGPSPRQHAKQQALGGREQQPSQQSRDSMTLHTPPKKRRDFYAMLMLSKGATAREIKKAFTMRTKHFDPEQHKDEEKRGKAERNRKLIARAYAVLSDPDLRARYDRGEDVE